jgi:hypothetical protein
MRKGKDPEPDPFPLAGISKQKFFLKISVPDPVRPDPHVFVPPGSGSKYFYHHAKIVRKTLIPTIL